MKKTFKVHLRSGTTIKFKADDFSIKYDNDGNIIEWSVSNTNRWFTFMPSDLVAVERMR